MILLFKIQSNNESIVNSVGLYVGLYIFFKNGAVSTTDKVYSSWCTCSELPEAHRGKKVSAIPQNNTVTGSHFITVSVKWFAHVRACVCA